MPREEVSFARGTKATMPQDKVPGRLLIATDTGEAYVDDTTTSRVQLKDTTKVSKSGDIMSGPLNMGSNKITNVATPTADTDAANLGSVKSETAKVKYTSGTAITVDDSDKTISHNNIGIAGSVGPSANATPAPGGTFNVPQITTDAQGHVSSKTNRTVTIPQYSAGTGLSINGTAISHANNGTAGSYGPTGNVTPGYGGTFEIPQITTNAQGHVTAITMRTVRLPSAQDIPEIETYTGVSPITVSGTQISHNNIGTAGSVGPTGNSTATHGGTITIPYITVDAKGHVSAKENRTITLPAGPVNMRGATSSAAGSAGYVPAPAAGASNRYLRSDGTWAVPASTTYTAARGLSLSGTEIGHSNSAITAGNRGPTANATISPGSTFSVPQIYYDAYGHVTSSATNRTMTLNSSILDTSDILTSLSGATSNTKVLGAKLVADAINNLNRQVSTLNGELAKKNKIYVNACDYGFSTENVGLENSQILQTIVNTLNEAGGGTIYVPAGTYDMDNTGYGGGNNQTGYCVLWKSNVSLKGDGTSTKFNKVCHTTYGNTLFFYDDLFSNDAEQKYIENVVMEDFSITAQDETWDYASSSGKGIFFVPPKNCHIKRVKVYGTPATALAFDCPVECSIEECHVENAGRSGYTAGCAGIGNGTGLAEKESCIVARNVIIGGTGTRFGIFHENQAAFNLGGTSKEKGYGQVITENIIIGCQTGIGGCIANGESIIGNIIMDSDWNGIYIGSHAKDITVKNNMVSKPKNYGILIEGAQWDSETTPIDVKNITIEGNVIIDPVNRHIVVSGNKNTINDFADLCIQGNKLYGGTGNTTNIAITAKDSNGLKMRNVCLKDNIGYGLNPDEINLWNADIENLSIFANVIKNITLSECALTGEKRLEATGNITEDGKIVSQKTDGIWNGKTFTAFGTGISYLCQNYNGGYLEKIKELCGFADYGNAGVSGAPMVNDTVNGNGINYMIKNTVMSRDLILIECCTNDFKLNVPVGLLETTNVDTFSGALKDALEHIFTNYPAKQVVIIADPQRDNDGYDVEYRNAAGCRLIDYIDMAILIGNKYGIPVCDLYRNSGINTLNLDTYTVDGLHPNAEGYDLIGKCAAGVINGMTAGSTLAIPNVDEDILLGEDYYDISESAESKYKIVMIISGTYYLYHSHMPFWVYKDGENYHEVLDITMSERLSAENKVFGNGTWLNSEGSTALDSIFRYMNGARTIDQFICANHDVYLWGTNTKILRKSFD